MTTTDLSPNITHRHKPVTSFVRIEVHFLALFELQFQFSRVLNKAVIRKPMPIPIFPNVSNVAIVNF